MLPDTPGQALSYLKINQKFPAVMIFLFENTVLTAWMRVFSEMKLFP
jgi:hypothetical protein